jgi:hypothetical protein
MPSVRRTLLLTATLSLLTTSAAVAAPWCGSFGYGNAGYAAGYSIAASRSVWGGGWCGPRWGWGCGPRIPRWCGPCGPAFPRRCWPNVWVGGWPTGGWCGTPWFGGGYGAGWYRGYDSVFLSAPAGGGATFFSGAIVPYPVPVGWYGWPANWLPGWGVTPWGISATPYGTLLPAGVGPQFGPAGVLPFLGVNAAAEARGPAVEPSARLAVEPRPVIAASIAPTGRTVAIRASNGLARLRAARLVAAGDAQLRKAAGDREKLTAALASYRQAAAAAADQPDTHVRQAVVLVALDRAAEAKSSIERAIAIDGRLAAPAGPAPGDRRQAVAFDPVFDRRPAGEGSAIAQRGAEILRQIGGASPADQDAIAWLADRWSAHEPQAAATVASTR